ncbi:TetR/AcrR family transcriptional regulator, mexJK operon transcriptional repressor [Parapedobacter composti]|uniref:TetR/AcrR family transcriptional regulator, mexJK operon transcriptional repressor n=1 Tax=Parapedobacter composti TaxID=623281 RepID=A0A1I1G972_9SPHI|nr:TetR/AcrR family transcriptional regulator [Parapedobacter composti]SFC07852.1 TetR/AcrR family transcriptional regulator, mexJK operon transcriptional repressor [Parapedobacter composti]
MIDDKKSQIIAAALKRFSHFGIAKTSMSEIADDLKLSKANLYYYFPDKFSLIEAIVYQIMEETDVSVEQALAEIPDTLALLIKMLDLKKEYFEKYYMLVINLHEMNISEEKWQSLSNQLFQREVQTISRIFKKGIDSGELVTFDVATTSELYVAMIRGLALFCDHAAPHALIDKAELVRIIQKQKQAAYIFVNGIKK